MLCSPYAFEPRNISDNAWKVAATLYNGSIYLSEIETEESKKKEEGMSDKGKEMCYWGLKFEDYVTSRGGYCSLSLSLSLSLYLYIYIYIYIYI